ncbi:MAG: heme-degrading domain-containing protein [Pseudomonadota bacterium]
MTPDYPIDSAALAQEAATLIFARFTEDTALKLGLVLVEMARADGMAVVIDIRTANRTLFHAALPGSAPLNDMWARRKSNTALRFQLASLQVGAVNREKGETLAQHGLSPEDHADHGGAVPIRVDGVGVVAVATVSGLPQVEDHRLVVRGIQALLR